MSNLQLGAANAGETLIALEPWDSVWPEVSALVAEHHAEVDEGVEPRRPLAIDVPRMRAMSMMGVLMIVTARKGGKLVGYLTWQVMPDLESEGLLIAQQG